MNIEIIIPPLHRRWNRGILYSPRCLSVRPSVCRQLDFWNFKKKTLLAQFISYLAFTLMGWVSWPLFIFVFLASFLPYGGQISGRKWDFRNFLKKLLAQFISYLVFTLMGWVSWPLYIFVFLASFAALWWPNILPKMGFPESFWKNYWLNSYHTWHLLLWDDFLDSYTFSCSSKNLSLHGFVLY